MVRYNNELDEYESYYHHDDQSSRHSTPRSHRSGYSSRPVREEPTLPVFGHAVSGAVGAALTNIVTYPLDVISTRLKVQRYALAQRAQRSRAQKKKYLSDSSSSEDEVKGIFNVSKQDEKRYGKYTQETAGGTRIIETWEYEYDEDELYEGHFDAARKIYEREGIEGFYHGVIWDTLGTVASGFWYFMAYNLLRKQRLHIMGQRHPNVLFPVQEELGIGIAAAALSKIFSAPMSNIVTRKQTAAMLYPNAKTPSFLSIYHDIMREKGICGLWSGYKASLLLTLNPSITFLLYEAAKPHLMNHKGSLDKFDTFMLAALCKAAATTLTYPLNIIRIRSEMDEGSEEWEHMYEGPTAGSSKGIHIERERERFRSGVSPRYGRAMRKTSGIIGLISEIVKREGIHALYIGLGGSIAKGFFSHGVTTIIKEHVHRLILKLYFFVLDAYNRSEEGSFREKALEKTLVGAQKAGHVAGAGKRKIESAKDKIDRLGEKVKEKVHIDHHHSTNHNHSDRHRSRERLIEGASVREGTRTSLRGRSEEEDIFEERITSPRERTEHTVIREERITGAPRSFEEERFVATSSRERGPEVSGVHNRSSSFREEHIRSTPPPPPPPAPRPQRTIPSTAVALSSGSLVGTPPVPAGKTMEKVANWREKVAEEMLAAKETAINNDRALVTTKHEILEGAHGETIDRVTTKETIIDHPRHSHGHHHHHHSHRRLVSREPSLASGQSYRSAGARTSLLVHPPSSVRERMMGTGEEWIEDTRLSRIDGRSMMGGGDVGINGEIRRNPEGKGWK